MMTDAEVADQIARADRFIQELRDAIAEAIENPASAIDGHERCLRWIADTLDAVPYVTFCNLANLDAAFQNRMGTTIMSVIRVYLMSAGCGPTLDFEGATAFLASFDGMIAKARQRMLQ